MLESLPVLDDGAGRRTRPSRHQLTVVATPARAAGRLPAAQSGLRCFKTTARSRMLSRGSRPSFSASTFASPSINLAVASAWPIHATVQRPVAVVVRRGPRTRAAHKKSTIAVAPLAAATCRAGCPLSLASTSAPPSYKSWHYQSHGEGRVVEGPAPLLVGRVRRRAPGQQLADDLRGLGIVVAAPAAAASNLSAAGRGAAPRTCASRRS